MSDAIVQRWCMSHRFDPAACRLADRHYSRQKPGTPQFVRTGSCLVLLSDCGRALWVTSWQKIVKHAWPGAWECSIFRSEGAGIASQLIRLAIAATRAFYGPPPAEGMITLIDPAKVRPIKVRGKDTFGLTWIKAGFRQVGMTKGRKLVFHIDPSDMPAPMAARPRSMHGAPLFDARAA